VKFCPFVGCLCTRVFKNFGRFIADRNSAGSSWVKV